MTSEMGIFEDVLRIGCVGCGIRVDVACGCCCGARNRSGM